MQHRRGRNPISRERRERVIEQLTDRLVLFLDQERIALEDIEDPAVRKRVQDALKKRNEAIEEARKRILGQ